MTGKPLLDKILMALNLAALFGCLGVFIYTTKMYKKPLPDEGVEFDGLKEDAKKRTETPAYKMEKITINLYSTGSRLRFLDLELHFLPFNEEQIKILETHKAHLVDMMIEVVGDMSPEELNSISGKILLESRLKKRINDFLGSQTVREIYFSTFIIQ